MSKIIMGSARQDENGKYQGGAAGDQKQKSTPDYSGEVSRQTFYVHDKGWNILRAKSATHANAIAKSMAAACDNQNIGYSQSDRSGILKYGTATTVKTNCDCSSLVRQCVKEATGKDPGQFHTGNEADVLMATGLFDKIPYTASTRLYTGDIIVTQTKGHTGVMIAGEARSMAVTDALVAEVKAGKWGNGKEREKRLTEAGYNYEEVRAKVNATYPKEVAANHVDQKGIDLIKRFEGCKLKAYRLDGEKYYSIGYAHSGPDVLPNMTISQERADEMLKADLVKYENYVKKYVTDIVLTQSRLDALTSYCYNRGVGGIKQLAANSHTVEQYADNLIVLWGSSMRYKDALLKRRHAEREMFLS